MRKKKMRHRYLPVQWFKWLAFTCLLINLAYGQMDYHALHKEALVVDLHSDVLLQILRGQDFTRRSSWGHIDLVRLQEGGIDVQFFALWPNPDLYRPDKMFEQTLNLIALFTTTMNKCRDRIELARSPQDIYRLVDKGKIAACLGVEGGTAIENDLQKLEKLYTLGVRYMGLTWNDSPDWASSAQDEVSPAYQGVRGLSEFGKQVVAAMNTMGMIIDVSHSGEKTFWDVIQTSTKPIIASHSCVYALAPHVRNLKDEQIVALAKNSGMIGINFYAGYLDSDFDHKFSRIRKSAATHLDSMREQFGQDFAGYRKYQERYYRDRCRDIRPDISRIVDHIEYIINLVGDDYVGFGSDFDGIPVTPHGLDDVSYLPEITRIMVERGFSRERIFKILGGNFMRVFNAVQN
jgi:membrane dipeptidase